MHEENLLCHRKGERRIKTPCNGSGPSTVTMNPPRVIPKAPQTQALSSKTFTPPLLDGTLTLPELYEWHLKNTPNHPLFIFPRSNEGNRTILWPEAVRAIHTGARFVRKIMEWKAGTVRDKPVIAILAASGKLIAYFL